MGRLPRNYAPIDTALFSDPKIRGLSPGAKLLFVAALLDCNREMTDGALKRSDADHITRLVNVKKSCHAELLRAGLWLETGTGFQIAGFLDHNKSKAERTKAAADAKARYQEWLEHHSNDVYNAVSNDVGNPFVLSNREPENQRHREAEQAAIAGSVA